MQKKETNSVLLIEMFNFDISFNLKIIFYITFTHIQHKL